MTTTLVTLLAESATRVPQRPALVFRDRRLGYADLLAQALAQGTALVRMGIRPGDRVALMAPNTPEFAVGYFGILAAGAVVVPLNPLFKAEEVAYVLADSEARMALGLQAGGGILQTASALLPARPTVVWLDGGGKCDDAPPAGAIPRTSGDLAVCLYTSGTTGRPKGAMLTHSNLLANIQSFQQVLQVTEDEIFLAVLPLFHAYGATALLLEPLSIGATVVLEPRFVPDLILRTLVEQRVTIFMGVPSMFAVLAGLPPRTAGLARLRFCISGGAPLPPAVLEAFEARHGVRIYEGYGPTECSPVLTVNPLSDARKIGSVGPALPGVTLRIADEAGRSLPPGEVGEVVARGPNVMQGYLNRPEETAEVLRDGWYHTGDLGRMDADGYLYIVDRKKDLILVGGLNVYPREVELALEGHPAVAEAAVIGVPDPLRGEVVKALVIPRSGEAPAAADLIQWCRQRLANYKVPRTIDLVSDFPRTITGKVLKAELRSQD